MRILALLCIVTTGFCQGINTKVIGPEASTKIVLSQSVATVLQFPTQFNGVYGLGLVGKDAKDGDVQVEYGANRPLLILHPLKGHVRTCMTVYMAERMYVFDLVDGQDPDVAVTLKYGSVSDPSQKVTPQTVVDSRPKYSPEMLVSLMDRAQGAVLLQASDPDDFHGYEHRTCNYTSDDTYLKTVAKDIHKFPDNDAIVLMGQIANETDKPLGFDSDHAAISVGNVKHPITLISCPRPIPAKATSTFTAVLVGDLDGSRANLSIDNELRLVVDTGHYKEGVSDKPTPTPTPIPSTPLTDAKQ